MKLNVDSSALGKPSDTFIGGVLCNHVGIFKRVFSKSIDIEDSNFAEFMAIKEGLLLSHHLLGLVS